MNDPRISVCITTHNRLEALKNAIYTVQNQTYPIYKIQVYASGYDPYKVDPQLNVPVSFEHDYKDWGHHKRAKAMRELDGDYIWTVCDDDQYLLTFLERMLPGMQADADIVYCNFATKTRPEYWCKAELERGKIGNGCILVSKRIAAITPYADMSYGGDWLFIEACLKNGATTYHVDESLFFHF